MKSNTTPDAPSPSPSAAPSLSEYSPSPAPNPKKRKIAAKLEPNGEATPEKKAGMMDRVITAGCSSIGMSKLAKEVQNAFKPNRKGNLRDKAVAAVAAVPGKP